jgi:type I restriction enzyme S subunit
MVFESQLLEFSDIQLIDGDRGKNYPKHDDFINSGDCLFLSAKNVTPNGFEFSDTIFINKEKDAQLRAGKLELGDIVVTTRGTIGNVALYDETVGFEHIRINSGMMIFRANPEVWNYRFLYFILTSGFIRKQIETLTSGSAVPQLPAKDLKKFKLPKVSKDIQDVIADNVGTLVDKITLNRQINQTLEQMAQTLFKSWFVDFDPVIDNAVDAGNDIPDTLQDRAEQRSLLRAKADFKPLPVETRALFPSEFEETELGWVPKGWDISTTGDEFEVKGGSTPSTANPEFWENGDIHWTSPKDLSDLDTKILLDTSRKITEAGLKKITSGLLPENTVLMSSRAPVGYLALAKIPVAINQGYIAIPSAKNFTAEYIIQWLDSNMDQIKGMAGGTTFAEISKSTFKTIEIVVPTKPVILEFTKMAKTIFDKITSNVKETSSLSNIRDSLLPKLISGELALDALPEAPELVEAL